MKRFSLVFAGFLLGFGFINSARAQICIDFLVFVDGLELTIEGDLITGYWRNYDSEGSDAPVVGLVRDIPVLPCDPDPTTDREPQYPGKAVVVCEPEFGCDAGPDSWYFIFDRMDGTLDVGYSVNGELPPPGFCGLDDLHYQILLGPCPFFGPPGGESLISSVEAVGR